MLTNLDELDGTLLIAALDNYETFLLKHTVESQLEGRECPHKEHGLDDLKRIHRMKERLYREFIWSD